MIRYFLILFFLCLPAFSLDEITNFNAFVAQIVSDVLKEPKYKNFDNASVKFIYKKGTDFSQSDKFNVNIEHTSTLNHLRWESDATKTAEFKLEASLAVGPTLANAKVTLELKTDVFSVFRKLGNSSEIKNNADVFSAIAIISKRRRDSLKKRNLSEELQKTVADFLTECETQAKRSRQENLSTLEIKNLELPKGIEPLKGLRVESLVLDLSKPDRLVVNLSVESKDKEDLAKLIMFRRFFEKPLKGANATGQLRSETEGVLTFYVTLLLDTIQNGLTKD